MKSNADADIEKVPHDWTIKTWPPGVFPYDGKKAKRWIRTNQKALVKAGAITRIGRDIVIIAAGWFRWYAANAKRVADYEVLPNLPQHRAKRFGGRDAEVA